MFNWTFGAVYKSEEFGLFINQSSPKLGHVHCGRTLPDRPFGVQWLTEGSAICLDVYGNKTGMFSPGIRIRLPDISTFSHNKSIIIAQETSTYYCICSINRRRNWDGEVHSLDKDEILKLPELNDRFLFVSKGSVTHKASTFPKHQVCKLAATDGVLVALEPSIVTIFYKV